MSLLGQHATAATWAHDILVPLWRYHADGRWESTARPLRSPAMDGSVAYYIETLSPVTVSDEKPLFDDAVARAACQYLQAWAFKHQVEIADGPFLQLREDDGAMPRGFVMLRAIVWCDEFDLLVPVDTPEAVAA